MPNKWKKKLKNGTPLMEKTEDSTNDFNIIMDKKFDEYKTYIIKLKQMGI